ncbi:MAG: DNA polymerase Y family protein [Burkholderiales bacterium]
MLWAALLLPRLPLEVYARAWSEDEAIRPFAVTSGGTRPLIVEANDAARAAGLKRGQPVAAALALAPSLVLRERDPAAETQALESVATTALAVTPLVSLEPPSAVLAEIGGSLALFGGLDRLRARLVDDIAARGHEPRVGVAPSPLAALALARMRRGEPVRAREALAGALADVPLAALDLDARIRDTLAAAGVRTIGAAAKLPRDGLARRFGDALVEALDRALGRRPDPRVPWTPPPTFEARLELPAPAHDTEALGFAAQRLLQAMAAWLTARGLGVQRFETRLVHERWRRERLDRRATAVVLALAAPSRSAPQLATLLRERLTRTELPAPVEGIELATLATAPLAGRPLGLLPGDEAEAPAIPLVDRLRARLGDDAVLRLAVRADHRPERAHAEAVAPAEAPASLPAAPRPLWILDEPQPLAAALARAPWALYEGPERIESGWWDGADVRRDYFVAQTPGGARAWIYRDHARGTDDGDWWLHGWFA